MNPQTVQATFGCLLHDVGKAVYRAGISDGRHGEAGYRFVRDIDGYGQAKAVLDCIRYHHAAQLRQAKDCDPLAAIAYIADNIAAAKRSLTAICPCRRCSPISTGSIRGIPCRPTPWTADFVCRWTGPSASPPATMSRSC